MGNLLFLKTLRALSRAEQRISSQAKHSSRAVLWRHSSCLLMLCHCGSRA